MKKSLIVGFLIIAVVVGAVLFRDTLFSPLSLYWPWSEKEPPTEDKVSQSSGCDLVLGEFRVIEVSGSQNGVYSGKIVGVSPQAIAGQQVQMSMDKPFKVGSIIKQCLSIE
jgi:hypothetical protein